LNYERLPRGKRSRRFCRQRLAFAGPEEFMVPRRAVAAALRAARRNGMTFCEQ
jgi:hypothetical protein